MKKTLCVALFISAVSIGVYSQQRGGADLSWAFPVKNGDLPPEEAGPKSVPGSTKSYTQAQIEDLSNPPDWFPEEHPPAPQMFSMVTVMRWRAAPAISCRESVTRNPRI